jgi:flagella basal body P-ring formation protein FlgA
MTRFLLILLSIIAACGAPAYAEATAGALPAEAASRQPFEVSYADAENAVEKMLNQKGIGDKIAVTINGRKTSALFTYEKPVAVEVKGLQFDRRDNHWSASLLFVSDGEVITAIPSSGRYDEMIELPVLKRETRSGDIISEANIEVRDFVMSHTRTDTISDISDLIGKSPLHSISPSRPIRIHEVVNPAIVKKNAVLQLRYHSPGMEITTMGEAMNDGAQGDVISVRNSASKKIVRAVITDSKTADIIAPGTEVSQSTGAGYAAN